MTHLLAIADGPAIATDKDSSPHFPGGNTHTLRVEDEWDVEMHDQSGVRWTECTRLISFVLLFDLADGEVTIRAVRVIEIEQADERLGEFVPVHLSRLDADRYARRFMRLYDCEPDWIEGWNQTVLDDKRWWE